MKNRKARGIHEATLGSAQYRRKKISRTLGIKLYNDPVSSFLRFGCGFDTESMVLSRFFSGRCGSDFRSRKIELKSVLTNSSKSSRLNISSWVTSESHSLRSQITLDGGADGGG